MSCYTAKSITQEEVTNKLVGLTLSKQDWRYKHNVANTLIKGVGVVLKELKVVYNPGKHGPGMAWLLDKIYPLLLSNPMTSC